MIGSTFSAQLMSLSATYRSAILWVFRFGYALVLGGIVAVCVAAITRSSLSLAMIPWGLRAGELAIPVFILVLLPGMLRRFGISLPFVPLLMAFRRQLGITMYLLVLFHYVTLRFTLILRGTPPEIPPPFFEVAGMVAFLLLTPLFITSNDQSVRRLGKHWKTLHRAVYVIVWIILLHVALQGSKWAIPIGIAAVGEMISLIKLALTPSSYATHS